MSGIYRFGEFRLDTARRLLERGEAPVTLTPKAYDLFRSLIENRDRLLTKDELLEKVWPETFVEEGLLKYNVSILRKAMGDQAWIETQPRRGYRFRGEGIAESVAEVRTSVVEKTEVAVQVEAELDTTVRTWRWVAMGVTVAAVASAMLFWPKPGESAVGKLAVLPFQSLSGQTGDREMELGFTDSLITRLAAEGPWLVRPTGAVIGLSGASRDPMAAGQKLDVDAVLAGSLQRSGDRLRLPGPLLRVRDGKHLWTGKFDARLTELFAMEDRIAAEVAQALSVRLRATGNRHSSSQPAVYEQYLSGRQFFLESTVRGTRRASQCFENALQIDPGFAPAYGMLALSYWQLSQRGGGPASDVRDKMWSAANKAVELDPENAEGRTALSIAKMWLEYDWDGGRREYERALELSPRQW